MMKRRLHLSIDIGGSHIKGISMQLSDSYNIKEVIERVKLLPVVKVNSRLSEGSKVEDFISALDELITFMGIQRDEIISIGISTAGVVNYAGDKLLLTSSHLAALKDERWITHLKQNYTETVIICNDADAAAIGAAQLGYISGFHTYGIMPIGTGLGFTVIRNGRKWSPNFSYTLLGSIDTPVGNYDTIASASRLAEKDIDSNLINIFIKQKNQLVLDQYIKNLAGIISTASIIYGIDTILIGGGLADAAICAGFDLHKQISQYTNNNIVVKLLNEGNQLPLLGAMLLSIAEEKAQLLRRKRSYGEYTTEIPFDKTLHLQKMNPLDIVELMWSAEQSAGERLIDSLSKVAYIGGEIRDVITDGGRLIYVGSGTSGRLAAVDTVEIACTFGLSRDKVLTLISGGVADAAVDIETRFEEDASAVPEMLLANVTAKDIVIGISVSGSAYYVQSALGYAKSIGAYSVMIQEEPIEELRFCDTVISLRTGGEIVAGSTRMKAGTATKKVLNFISTTAMIGLGRVYGSYMTEVECINGKLIKRAENILNILFGINSHIAYELLKKNNFNLNEAIREYETK